MSIYDFTVADKDGKSVSLSNFKGKILLIVNTATHCGFTPQYAGLQKLYETYCDKGFEILDFPCNQFGKQAPGSAEEICAFCMNKYHAAFPQFAKIDVNGEHADPLFVYLKAQKKGVFGSKIKWNFTKFLVDKNGTVIKRYGSTTKPETIEDDLKILF
jgi:glutathione peroxidase